eukprot:GHVR01159158.1.p1 GENE.GHVR01159158.1~~GHVR01159158.1.p1  ORF type:complete len:140 (+),score=31.09 GHVR01159158.1:195-614(+)
MGKRPKVSKLRLKNAALLYYFGDDYDWKKAAEEANIELTTLQGIGYRLSVLWLEVMEEINEIFDGDLVPEAQRVLAIHLKDISLSAAKTVFDRAKSAKVELGGELRTVTVPMYVDHKEDEVKADEVKADDNEGKNEETE